MFSRFFIERPVFSSVLSIVIMVAGLASLVGLPIAEYPDMAPPSISVTAVYPGADAQIIADTVASPVEQEVNGVEGMLFMKSTCSGDGRYVLTVTFETGTDLDIASVQVQNRVAAAEPRLPESVRRNGINTQKKMPDFAQMVSVTSTSDLHDDVFLSNYATLRVLDQLKRIDGVGDVTVFGAAEYAMRVWIDPDKLDARGATTTDVLSAIQDQNVQVAAGKIGEPPAQSGIPFQYTVTARGRLTDVSEFEAIVIRTDDAGRVVRVRDVARVELGAQTYSMASRVNEKPAAVLAVYQLPGANLIQISDAIKAELESAAGSHPEGIAVDVTYDAANVVRASIAEIVTTLFVAAVLVILTVLIFLQDFRATIIPAVAIPVSLVGAFAAMGALGFSLNTLTLFGLVLAIGIVVDDAIVVVENVARTLDETDLTPREASIRAMKEVSGPVVATTLVLLAVFVPTSFLGGLTGVMYRQFGLTIAAATIFSSINALTLSPALCALLMRRSTGRKNILFRFFDAIITKCTVGYTAVVSRAVRKVLLTTVFFIGITVLGALGFLKLPSGFVPPEDKGFAMAVVQLPDAASRERTLAVSQRVDAILASTPGVQSFITIDGFSLISNAANPNVASHIIVLDPWDERTSPGLSQDAVIGSLQRQFASIQEGFVFAFAVPPVPGVGIATGFDMQVQDRGGLGVETLAVAAADLAQAANAQAGLSRVNSGFRASVPQLFVDVDREKVKQLGLSMQSVFGTLQANLGGSYANDFNTLSRTFQVKVQADSAFRARPEDILKLKIRDDRGAMIPLASVITVEERFGPTTIDRYNLYTSASVTGQAAPGFSSGDALNLMEGAAAERLPAGVSFEWTGLAFQEREAGSEIIMIFGLAILLVFLVLAAQYESYILPFSIIAVVPLGLLGVAAGAFFRGFDNNVYTQIGVVLLVALVSKNAILIVEFAREKRSEGMSVADAAIEAARLRFRPILMTAFSFILGTFPLVIASGAGAGARTALGTAVFAGLTLATLIGIVVTPAIYRVVQGTGERLGRAPSSDPPKGRAL